VTALLKDMHLGVWDQPQQHLQIEDDKLAESTYDFFMGEIIPGVPRPAPEQFADGIRVMTARNPKLADFDVSGFLDPSFVKSAEARGLAGTGH
jgi:hypothetical protein